MHNAHCACINKHCSLRVIYLGNCECQLYIYIIVYRVDIFVLLSLTVQVTCLFLGEFLQRLRKTIFRFTNRIELSSNSIIAACLSSL